MDIREIDLPGIGKKFELLTKSGDKMVVIIHDDGRREIYNFVKGDYEECSYNMVLDDSEARQVSAILGGIIYTPKELEKIDMVFDDLVIEWFKVDSGAKAVDKTIGDLHIRQTYEVTVIAIIRNNKEKVINPGSGDSIKEGDTLVLSGDKVKLKSFIKNLLKKGDT